MNKEKMKSETSVISSFMISDSSLGKKTGLQLLDSAHPGPRKAHDRRPWWRGSRGWTGAASVSSAALSEAGFLHTRFRSFFLETSEVFFHTKVSTIPKT